MNESLELIMNPTDFEQKTHEPGVQFADKNEWIISLPGHRHWYFQRLDHESPWFLTDNSADELYYNWRVSHHGEPVDMNELRTFQTQRSRVEISFYSQDISYPRIMKDIIDEEAPVRD